jgi:hypothetical protein
VLVVLVVLRTHTTTVQKVPIVFLAPLLQLAVVTVRHKQTLLELVAQVVALETWELARLATKADFLQLKVLLAVMVLAV